MSHVDFGSCSSLWDVETARLNSSCQPWVILVPSVVAIFIAFVLLARPVISKRPTWLKRFANEAEIHARNPVGFKSSKSWTHWTAFLVALAVIGLLLSLVTAIAFAESGGVLFYVISWTIITLITTITRPRTTPFSLLVLYLVLFASVSFVIPTVSGHEGLSGVRELLIAQLCISGTAVVVILLMPMREPGLTTADIGNSKLPPTADLRSPEDNISLFQWSVVSWMAPVVRVGKIRQLHDEDIWLLPFEFQHTRLHMLFRDLKGSVLLRLLKANGMDLAIVLTLGVFENLLNFATPVLLQQLLRAVEDNRKDAAVTYGIIIAVCRLTQTQSSVFSLWFSRRCYERSRGEMITMIYEKTLNRKAFNTPSSVEQTPGDPCEPEEQMAKITTLSRAWLTVKKALRIDVVQKFMTTKAHKKNKKDPASLGKILNLMKNDVYEVAQRFWDFEIIVTKPLTFFLSIILIWKLLGSSCLIGVGCVLAAQAVNFVFFKILLRLEKVRRTITDSRLSVSSEYIESIRHLRWYDWQGSWLHRILEARQSELHLRVVTGLWKNAISLSNQLASRLFPVVAFAAYTLITKKPLTVDIAFPALQLFSMLDRALRDIPNLITVLLNASVALGRINDFMAEPDRQEVVADSRSMDLTIRIEEASFAWPGVEANVLKNISIKIVKGLTIVCGRVGSGKTALLQAILGELDQNTGTISRPDEMVGYCTQSPWLQSMSIRENILFTSPYDEHRYKQTLDACALLPDLVGFTHGDLSNIGENGVGLSGGQKARVALARAVYSRAKILLLDDPLAALDHDTATSIVERLLTGSLVQGRLVILVTHRVDLLAHLADQILEVQDGAVQEIEKNSILSTTHGTRATIPDPEQTESKDKETANDGVVPDKFIEEEHRATGGVVFSVYWRFIKSGDLRIWTMFLVILLVHRFFRIVDFYFLKEWGEGYNKSPAVNDIVSGIFTRFPNPGDDVKPWLFTYLGIALIQTMTNLFIELTLLMIIYVAGKRLFSDVLHRVSGATFRYYDTTPVGRIMNRLTSDFGTLDGGIASRLQDFVWCFVGWASAMIVIASTTPAFLILSIFMSLLFGYIFLQFLPTSQSLRRLEMISLTPLMSNFGILLEGLATVRAFRAQPQFQNRIIAVTDSFQKMDHFYWSLQSWLSYRFGLISAVSNLGLTLLALYQDLSPGLTAFVLTTASTFITYTHYVCQLYGELQMNFVSVERVIELLDLEQENPGSIAPPAAWPSHRDDVVFDSVTLKYAEHLPPALEDATFHIPGGSTTAIIGRTGSGKSTLALALLATIRPVIGGSIKIGSMDLSKVDVHALRQRITFVAQDPVLFPGTLRQNLDPTESYSDTECEAVLKRVLGTTRSITAPSTSNSVSQDSQPELTLATTIASGGKNLSQGQRQLLGLGRAILRRSPVVVLDEATASIDVTTAAEVQRVLRDELKESTVIMIAHRVEAVRSANWAIVLDKGKVAQVGPAEEIVAKRFADRIMEDE